MSQAEEICRVPAPNEMKPPRRPGAYTRREIIQRAAAIPLLLSGRTGLAAEGSMQDRTARAIREYSEQGIHRSGTEGDLENARWLSESIRSLGLEPELNTFSFQRVRPLECTLAIEGRRVEAIPLYDCTYTDSGGISGHLGEIGSDADIGVVSAFPLHSSPGGQLLEKARREGHHKAIVVVTDESMPPGIAITNAEDFGAPFGPPTLQVSNAEARWIRDALTAGSEARVIAHCDYVGAKGINVGTTIPGKRPNLPPLVVMTPRSGWWACASERGGGIAAWLEIMRTLSRSGADRDVIFTANTGHELGHVGLDHYLASREALIQGAHMWIHLGANFAAAIAPGVLVQSSDEKARTRMTGVLSRQGLEPDAEIGPGQRPLGEARNIYDGGGRYVSVLGRNGLFHHPLDVWPDPVDLATTTRWVAAFSEIAQQFSSHEGR